MRRLPTLELLANHLEAMCTNTQDGLSGKKHWWVFGPFFCRKFLNQTASLKLLLNQSQNKFDVSSVWSIIRSLYETHATYYHLFIPCENIEENILRFRLWELDSTLSLIEFRRNHVEGEVRDRVAWLIQNEDNCKAAIRSLAVFSTLPERSQNFLLQKSNWRMILPDATQRVSYDNLIKNTGIKDSHFEDMYAFTSMHVHPAYGGIRQNLGLEETEIEVIQYTAIMQACYVTSFFVKDLKARYVQAKDYYDRIPLEEQKIIESFEAAARNK